MSEDYELCTYEKHHKLKILLFLSSMRSFKDELKSKNFKLIYEDINSNFKISYDKKLEKIIKDKKIKEVSFFEIEDKLFEKKVISLSFAFFNDEISSIRISEFSIELNLPLT